MAGGSTISGSGIWEYSRCCTGAPGCWILLGDGVLSEADCVPDEGGGDVANDSCCILVLFIIIFDIFSQSWSHFIL